MQELLDVDAKDIGSRLCLEDRGLTVGFLTSLLFDTSFTKFRFCLLMNKIATDQKFVAWKRCIRSWVSYALIGYISEKLKISSVTPWSFNYLCLYWFLCRNHLSNYSSFIFLSFLVHLSTIFWAELTVRKDVHHFELSAINLEMTVLEAKLLLLSTTLKF